MYVDVVIVEDLHSTNEITREGLSTEVMKEFLAVKVLPPTHESMDFEEVMINH